MTESGGQFELRIVVTTAEKRRFSASAANLTHASLFLETSEKLAVHDRVKLSIQELELEAEVGLVSVNPSGLVMSFRAPAGIHERLEGLIARVRVLGSGADEPWSERTVPGDEADIAAATMAAREAAHGNATDSVSASGLPGPTGEFAALTPNPFASQTPTPFSEIEMDRAAHRTSDVIEPSVSATMEVALRLESIPPGEPASPEASLPELAADGTLRFASARAFQAQFATNLVHGGIVARSSPLPIGSQKMLKFSVPGVSDDVQLSARVGFVGQGTVGFMIDTFAVNRPRLESILHQIA